MKCSLNVKLEKKKNTAIVLFAAENGNKNESIPSEITDHKRIDLSSFKGKKGETLYIPLAECRLIIAGIGKTDDISAAVLRDAAAAAVRCAADKELTVLSIIPSGAISGDESLAAATEGILLGSYSFDKYKEEKKKQINEVTFISSVPEGKKILRDAEIVCRNTLLCRDLVNATSEEVNPEALATLAKAVAKESSLKYEEIKGSAIEKLGMGLFSAVARGSIYGPYLLMLSYTGNPKSKERTALVGKGITFDSGGYNLKPTGHMETMRCDMAGAAAVLYTMKSIAQLGIRKNVTAYLPVCENMISSRAYKPGDVFKAFDGTTVEILSTDAEGRLVMADTIAYAVHRHKPSRIIEASTLTGACVTTFGELYAALLTNNEDLRTLLENASAKTGERIWSLPLDKDYSIGLDSDIADIRNINPERTGGTIAGGLFLERFAKETPFAHLDIAGTAWLSKERGVNPKNATGFGVRLLTEAISCL
jgi:leucyl aminopeptidase